MGFVTVPMQLDLTSISSTSAGALIGSAIGDTLAMPVHWYYNTAALASNYGEVRDFIDPKSPHPDSILWRSSYSPLNETGEILHDQAEFWGKRGIHYHQNLAAGENTVTVQLANLLQESLLSSDGYDADDYLSRYIDFMTTPGSHRDTYLEECHRGFFQNYARGEAPKRCSIQENILVVSRGSSRSRSGIRMIPLSLTKVRTSDPKQDSSRIQTLAGTMFTVALSSVPS